MVLFELVVLLLSILVLSRSSAMIIESAVRLSRFFNISQLAVGILLVAVATSLPELSISITSSSAGEGALAAGNVFGSNIANILVILGAAAFLYGIKISPRNLKDIGLALLLTTLISIYIIYNSSVQQKALNFFEGAVLIGIFGVYVWDVLRKKRMDDGKVKAVVKKKKALESFLHFSLGIMLVVVSSAFVVDSAVAVATSFGIAKSFIGATFIAFGTSLPELSIALQAIRKSHYGLVLGNVIGSNVTNITLVLGVASVINPIEVRLPVFIAALLFAVVANSILFYVGAINKSMARFGGALFLIIYVVYLVTIFGLQVGELS